MEDPETMKTIRALMDSCKRASLPLPSVRLLTTSAGEGADVADSSIILG
jgi:hypothetical protein